VKNAARLRTFAVVACAQNVVAEASDNPATSPGMTCPVTRRAARVDEGQGCRARQRRERRHAQRRPVAERQAREEMGEHRIQREAGGWATPSSAATSCSSPLSAGCTPGTSVGK
jgi:hypothetical protein